MDAAQAREAAVQENAEDTAAVDEMADAIAFSVPLRNLVLFGLYNLEDIQKMLEEYV